MICGRFAWLVQIYLIVGLLARLCVPVVLWCFVSLVGFCLLDCALVVLVCVHSVVRFDPFLILGWIAFGVLYLSLLYCLLHLICCCFLWLLFNVVCKFVYLAGLLCVRLDCETAC